jgi:hypothetical protein
LARGTTDWPKDVDGRGLKNKSVEDYGMGVDAQRLRAAYDQALATKNFGRLEVWAGTGVGHITKVSSTRVSFGRRLSNYNYIDPSFSGGIPRGMGRGT